MNDLTSFVELVKSMRAAQKTYFKNRTQTDLRRSKALESQVDSRIETLSKSQPEAEQLPLVAPTEG